MEKVEKKSQRRIINIPISASFKKYLSNIGWLLFSKFFNLGVAFFVGVYVARYLGPENYGIISFSLSIIAFLAIFTGLGLKSIIARELVQDEGNKDKILGTAFFLELSASILSLLLLFSFSDFLDLDDKALVILAILSTKLLLTPSELIGAFYHAQVKAKKTTSVTVSKTLITALLKVFLVYTEQDLEWFAVVYVIESLVGTIGIVIVYLRNGYSPLNWKFNKLYAKALFSDSWPLILSGFVVVVYMKIDTVMIKYMIDDAAVGVYSVARKFTSIWFFAGGMIAQTLLPSVIKTRKRDYKLYEKRFQYLFDLMMLVGIAIALPMTIVADFVIDGLYGIEFSEAASVLVIQVWSLVFIFMGNAAASWYLAENLQKSNLTRTILGALVNVGLNFILIPNYGIQGAAFATLVSQGVASCLSNYIGSRQRQIFWMQVKSLLFISILKSKADDNIFYFIKSHFKKS